MLYGNRTEILADVGASLRARRLRLNLSQETAAARSGIAVATLRNFEKGKGISLWGFISLCRTYGHDQWVYELAPESVDDFVARLQPAKARQRAAKRKETDHV